MSRRALIVALVVSVAVNLFVIGGLAGAALIGLRMHGGPPPPRPHIMALGVDLPPADQAAWRAILDKTAQEAGPKFRQARTLRRQAWEGLAADPVDVQAVEGALSQARDLETQARGAMDSAVVRFAGGLPPKERRQMAEALSRARIYGPRAGGWSGGRRPPGPPSDVPPNLPDR